MYFDWLYYRKVVAFVWAQKSWPGRNKMLLRLLVAVPLHYVFNCVCFLLDYVFFPSLWRQKVVEPVFVVGHARSGTTLMHRLLAADGERFSYFYYWEMFFPALTQRVMIRAIGVVDQTLLGSRIKKRFEALDEKLFGRWRHIHSQGFWIAEEDQFVMKGAFVTQQWALDLPLMHEVDVFHVDNLSAERRRRWMHHYKECVKRQLLWNGGNKTHLSKNPVMSGWVDAIIDTFPDAKIVVMVRDPAQCIPSTLKLVALSWQARKWSQAQYRDSLNALTEISFDCYELPARALSKRNHVPHKFVDYRDITTEPKQTVEAVYEGIGLQISDSYSQYLQEQQEKEKKHKTHYSYSIEEFEVTASDIEQRLAPFYDQYQWPRHSESEQEQAVEQ